MKLQLASGRREDYLKEVLPVIQFSAPEIQKEIIRIESMAATKEERAKIAFELVRDKIRHSFDIQGEQVTINAGETLEKGEGICFAKAHLLATLLRGMGIPAGFCYQRVLKKGTIGSGYALHGLNAVYLDGPGWFRVDPRGNKPGVDSQFSIKEEKLAYPIREEWGEVDYPNVFTEPLPSVIASMRESENCAALFDNRPEALEG
ncbi:MAG: transglutaminase family protein [Chitinophagaceae bacterium]|nr:transglutaminase family protein [Bacteroidota bacterium]MCC6257835.1 transglutaminase family protein [Chitinophagaceae bacterium]MCW5917466.1 transglutaminase family protein [Ferruginibacter sp.]